MTKAKTPPSKPTYTSEEILANAKFRLWNLCPPLCRPYDIYVVEGNAPFAGYATEKRICISDSVLKKKCLSILDFSFLLTKLCTGFLIIQNV
jgi:hypothetical protein